MALIEKSGGVGGFVHFALGSSDIKKQYFQDTKININDLANRNTLEKMIDEKTDYEREMLSKSIDWITTNHWGEEA